MVTLPGFLPGDLDGRLVEWLCDEVERAAPDRWVVSDVRGVKSRGLTLTWTVRELCGAVMPAGSDFRRDWPRLRTTLFRLGDYAVPDPGASLRTGSWRRGKGWRPFALRGGPLRDGAEPEDEDLVVVDVLIVDSGRF